MIKHIETARDQALALMAERRKTNGYIDFEDLRALLPRHDKATAEGSALAHADERALHVALAKRPEVAIDRDINSTKYRLLAC
jgi:hypothetical protein